MSTITITKERVEKQKGIVILPLKEYQKLCQQAVPIYYLKGSFIFRYRHSQNL